MEVQKLDLFKIYNLNTIKRDIGNVGNVTWVRLHRYFVNNFVAMSNFETKKPSV